MRNLFRRTSFFFWQYPILWLPVAIVDPIVFCFNLLDQKLTHGMILTLVTRHTVLGNAPESIVPSASQTLKIILLTKPINWGTHLVALCLYVSAMMTIFTLISALSSRQNLSFSRILLPLQHSFPRLVFFSLKLLIAIGFAAIPFLLVTVLFFEKTGVRYISIRTFSLIFSALACSAIAYLVAPEAVKLLRPHTSQPIASELAHQARISAALAVIACDILYFLATQTRPTFVSVSTRWIDDFIYEVVASLISATPYTVLFIALSLLAEDNERDAEPLAVESELT
jgi:hypothetical protein